MRGANARGQKSGTDTVAEQVAWQEIDSEERDTEKRDTEKRDSERRNSVKRDSGEIVRREMDTRSDER